MIADHGLKQGFLYKCIVCVGISEVTAMRLKIVPEHFRYFCSIVVEFIQ